MDQRNVWWSVLLSALCMSVYACSSNVGTPPDRSSNGDLTDAAGSQGSDSESETDNEVSSSQETTLRDVSKKLSPKSQLFFTNLGKARSGEDVDVDGDGYAEVKSTKSGSIIFTDVRLPGAAVSLYRTQEIANGQLRLSVDSNADGKVDREETSLKSPFPIRTVLLDTDFDERMDRKVTERYNLTSRVVEVVIETDAEKSGVWKEIYKDSHSIVTQSGGAACDGLSGFPTNVLGDTIAIEGVKIPVGGGEGRCSESDATKIVSALSCATGSGMACLRERQPEMAIKIFEKMRDDALTIGCGNSCQGHDASTETIPWLIDTLFPQGEKLNINPTNLGQWSDNEACTIMLHELLHWAGEGNENPAEHNQGKDSVYSCARFCSGQTSRGPWTGSEGHPGAAFDCAKCARSMDKKKLCGGKQTWADIPQCPKDKYCSNSDRECSEDKYCDYQTIIPNRKWTRNNCAACKQQTMSTCDGEFVINLNNYCCDKWEFGRCEVATCARKILDAEKARQSLPAAVADLVECSDEGVKQNSYFNSILQR